MKPIYRYNYLGSDRQAKAAKAKKDFRVFVSAKCGGGRK
jgi:hypothetical protein